MLAQPVHVWKSLPRLAGSSSLKMQRCTSRGSACIVMDAVEDAREERVSGIVELKVVVAGSKIRTCNELAAKPRP